MRDHAAAPSALQPTSPTAAELLLVDDDPVFGRVLATALGRRGFQVTLAASVAQARELLPQLRVSHAVLDLRLPDGSGLELVPLLRERLPQVRIVVLSGYASIPTAIDAIKLGATYYLAKPVDADAVVRAFDAGDAALPAISPLPAEPPSVRRVEWEHLQRVLKDCDGNVSAAARALRMHRRTLQRKLGKRSGSL
ncbi:response regulator transcription factor [Immundisolibacter cernigliae]|uniref:Response regulatory domain-containing protein n=1 Tax=Immundisolibacter cernigliae TaxID=1810504 RepID=A0A1B1YWI4_9GAMM|nr:response regulator [Immundisolibacter cernigliae]ANX05037.1 hypothetical protein PG2T_13200 [Immundisolibacter cernigliae]